MMNTDSALLNLIANMQVTIVSQQTTIQNLLAEQEKISED